MLVKGGLIYSLVVHFLKVQLGFVELLAVLELRWEQFECARARHRAHWGLHLHQWGQRHPPLVRLVRGGHWLGRVLSQYDWPSLWKCT